MNEYEVFCSYAHADNDDGWVDGFADQLTKVFRRLTGAQPAIFLDRESLLTADIWERKIRGALDVSKLLLAVVSPSYVKSEWCRREWELFTARENEMRRNQLISYDQGLIFPILLFPLDRGRFNEAENRFVATVTQRQWMDVSSQLDGTPIRTDQVRTLAEQLIDAVSALARATHRVQHPTAFPDLGATITDPSTGLEWAASLSATEISYDDAKAYAAQAASDGWRLPTRQELESIIDRSALSDDPKASPFPLREPFNAQRYGYLHSGTELDGGGNFIMNVRNGHIFNGEGNVCYVRLVRNLANNRVNRSGESRGN